jgi:tetratricopeptide (TPR) repeat protein
MRRRRFRIVILNNEDKQRAAAQPSQTAATAVNRAATVQPAESSSAPIWLKPSQQRLIDMQQQSGNQAAQRALGIVQRAPKDKDAQAQEDALNQVVDAPGEIQSLNEKPTKNSLFADAQAAYKNKKYGMALLMFRELYRQSFASSMLINMAVCELRLDLFEEAENDLTDALKDEALSPEDRTRAIAALDCVTKLDDADSLGFMSLPSNIDTEQSKLAKDPRAIRHQINSYYRTAESAAKSEDYDAAFNAFRIAQDRLPNPVTMINMGKILVMQQRYSEAASMFEKALHDRTLGGPSRKAAEAELNAAKKFQGNQLDMLGSPPADNKPGAPMMG